MRKADQQLGTPSTDYVDTKANLQALSGLGAGAVALASDTGQFGVYNGATWLWFDTGAGAGSPTHFAWDDPPPSPDAHDDEFNGSALASAWGGWAGSGAPTSPTVGNGLLTFLLPTGSHESCVLEQAPPSGSWTITTKCRQDQVNPSSDEDSRCGLFAGTSGSTVQVLCNRTVAVGIYLAYETWTHSHASAWSSPFGVANIALRALPHWNWLRLAWDNSGGYLHFLFSEDGYNWDEFIPAVSITAPNLFGVAGLRNGAGALAVPLRFDYFRCLNTFSPFAPANGQAIDFRT